jgi:hypothetical protein
MRRQRGETAEPRRVRAQSCDEVRARRRAG